MITEPTDPTRTSAGLVAADLAEIAPLLRRLVSLDPGGLVRLRRTDDRVTALVRTPFEVLAARSVRVDASGSGADQTFPAAEALSWIDGVSGPPSPQDHLWRWPVPPQHGWQRVDTVPDDVIRGLVRSGAMTLKEAAAREGVPDATPRAEVSDALLDSVVLTVAADESPLRSEVTLRVLSALTRLGFLARDSHAAIDVAGRWVRVAGAYGTVYREAAPSGLSVLR